MPRLLTLFALLSLLLTASCRTKRYVQTYNEDRRWSQLHYHAADTPPAGADTAFVMVSNRPLHPDRARFAEEDLDTTRLHYLLVQQRTPTDWDVTELPTLQACLAALPDRDWVIYSEGMGKLFTGNIERAQLMTRTYGVNVVLFDYASMRSDLGMLKNFRFSMQNSTQSARQYSQFLAEMQDLKAQGHLGRRHISIFLHSMGNLMLQEAVRQQQSSVMPSTPFADNLILNAACVPQKQHADWVAKLTLAQRVYVHYNRADYKLQAASILSGNSKLGSKPRAPFPAQVQYIDFHEAVGKTHNYFLWIPGRENPLTEPIRRHYQTVLHGEPVDPTTDSYSGPSPRVGLAIRKVSPSATTK